MGPICQGSKTHRVISISGISGYIGIKIRVAPREPQWVLSNESSSHPARPVRRPPRAASSRPSGSCGWTEEFLSVQDPRLELPSCPLQRPCHEARLDGTVKTQTHSVERRGMRIRRLDALGYRVTLESA